VITPRLIEEAFNHRRMPLLFLVSEQLAAHEHDDVMSFWGHSWVSVTGLQLDEHFDAIFWFTPEAFCYYLPGIFTAGINENNLWLIVNHSLANMLDRSPTRIRGMSSSLLVGRNSPRKNAKQRKSGSFGLFPLRTVLTPRTLSLSCIRYAGTLKAAANA
jgi:hypothetical protein